METNTCSIGEAAADGAVGEAAAGEAELSALLAAVDEAERQIARAVALAGRLAGSGVAERTHGLPLDLLLAADAGLTGADRHTLLTAGQVLESMPALAAAHRDGQVSWGQVRHVVRLLRRRSLADRAVIDARIAASLDAAGGQVGEPDAWCEALDAAVDELLSRRAVEARDERATAANRLWAQPGFDGRVHGGFDYDAISGQVVLGALAARQGKPLADEVDRPPEVPTPQQHSTAQALVDLCADDLAGTAGGSGGSGRRARPAYVADVDVDRLDANQPGRLRLRLPGPRPPISAKRIAADAAAGSDVRVLLTRNGAPQALLGTVATDAKILDVDAAGDAVTGLGIPKAQQQGMAKLLAAINHALDRDPDAAAVLAGHRPLCDPDLLAAADIPAATRAAVTARDAGCTMYGCDAPADWCDIHHLTERDNGGDHHPDNLTLLCRSDHKLTHDHGWTLAREPTTATLTGRRGTRTWHTRPRGSPLAPAPPPEPPADDSPPRAGPAGPPADAPPDPDLPF